MTATTDTVRCWRCEADITRGAQHSFPGIDPARRPYCTECAAYIRSELRPPTHVVKPPTEETDRRFTSLVSRLPDLPHGALAGGRVAEPLAFDDDSFPPMGCPFDEPLPPIEVPITTRAEEAEAEMAKQLRRETAAHTRTRDVLRDLVDGEPCDHYGDLRCTTHNARLPCPMAKARAHLAKYDDNPEETPDAE